MESPRDFFNMLRGKTDPESQTEGTVDLPPKRRSPSFPILLMMGLVCFVLLSLVGFSIWSALKSPAPGSARTAKAGSAPETMTFPDVRGDQDHSADKAAQLQAADKPDVTVTVEGQPPANAGTYNGTDTPAQQYAQQHPAPAVMTNRQGYAGGEPETSRAPARAVEKAIVIDYSNFFTPDGKLKTAQPAKAETAKAEAPKATPSLDEFRERAARAAEESRDQAAKQSSPPPTDSEAEQTRTSKSLVPPSAEGKNYVLFEGTTFETVLQNRITSNGQVSGEIKCRVSTDVYSFNHQVLLIPKGSIVLGTVRAVGSNQQTRLFVVFHRLIMVDGYSVSLDQFQGLNIIGSKGLTDQVNHHYVQIFGTSLALAGIAAVTQGLGGGAYGGYGGIDFGVSMRNSASTQLGQEAMQILSEKIHMIPTFTIRERNFVKVWLSSDLFLPDADKHTMPFNL